MSQKKLPVGAGKLSTGKWGVWTLIVTEGSLFGYLLLSYFYLYAQSEKQWPLDGPPELKTPLIATAILISSSFFVYLGELFVRKDKTKLSILPMLIAIILGSAFVGIQLHEYSGKKYGITTNLYGSLYYTITGFHMAHVIIGLVVLVMLTLWTALGYFDSRRYNAITIGSLYWHFVDVVWIFIFSSLYLLPYMQK